MGHLSEFEGKRFKDVARGDLELGSLSDAADKLRGEEALKQSKVLLRRIKEALGDRVVEVLSLIHI